MKKKYSNCMAAVPISTTISEEVKRAASAYCRKHGLKLGYFIERALVEQLEDEIDREAYLARRNEPTVSLDSILRARTKRKTARKK